MVWLETPVSVATISDGDGDGGLPVKSSTTAETKMAGNVRRWLNVNTIHLLK